MAIIAVKAWYLPEYEPIQELEKRSYDLRLSKKSLLKSIWKATRLSFTSRAAARMRSPTLT
jgi:hypothetical protein